MENGIDFVLDGKTVAAGEGETIWDVAKREGNPIPHLCHVDMPGYRPDGNCRACMVDIEGERVLAASCIRTPTPGMIVKLRALGEDATADVLEVILREEVSHVAAGSRWFRWFCEGRGIDPEPKFRELLAQYAREVLHGPFNIEARSAAGFSEDELAALQAATESATAER